MRRILLWAASTVASVGLLLGYHTSTGGVPTSARTAAAGVVSTTTAGPATGQASPPTTTGSTPPTTRSTTTAPTAPARATTRVVNGAVASTRYGDVQVQVTVTGGTLVKAVAIAYSHDGRNGEINAYAVPVLQAETVKAGSAKIDSVSGATFTSGGYLTSLQSALDAAGL